MNKDEVIKRFQELENILYFRCRKMSEEEYQLNIKLMAELIEKIDGRKADYYTRYNVIRDYTHDRRTWKTC